MASKMPNELRFLFGLMCLVAINLSMTIKITPTNPEARSIRGKFSKMIFLINLWKMKPITAVGIKEASRSLINFLSLII